MNEIKQWLLENEKILISKGDIRYSPSNIFTVEENLQLKNHQDIVNETKNMSKRCQPQPTISVMTLSCKVSCM